MPLFQPGVVLIPPDKETDIAPYVPGVIMSQLDGSVIGAVPNTVVDTSDGCVFADGTMCVNKHLTPFGLYFYDPNFNLIANNLVFSDGTGTSPPAPSSDFDQWAYMTRSGFRTNQLKRMNKSGAVDPTTWTLPFFAAFFTVDPSNTWLYGVRGSDYQVLRSYNLLTQVAGPIVATVDPTFFFDDMRVVPGTGDLLCFMGNDNIDPDFSAVEVWRIRGFDSASPGTVVWKTRLPAGWYTTDPTMQIDVGTPNTAFWCRVYGQDDRTSPCTFYQLRISDGAILNQWTQTIVQPDGGVPGGILPATCPLFTWSVSIEPAGCAVGIPSPPPTNKPACAPGNISGGQA